MKKYCFFFVIMLGIMMVSNAQRPVYQQNMNCLGLKNPSNFVVTGGPSNSLWYGYTGSKNSMASTCSYSGSTWGDQIQAAFLESTLNTDGCELQYETNTVPISYNIDNTFDWQRQFVIKSAGYDPETHNHLSYLPPDTSYHTSIRLGNYCGLHGAEKLYYEFNVNANNALVTLWYAMSLQNGMHGQVGDNPELVITIEKQQSGGNWTVAAGDTLCFIQHTPSSQNGYNYNTDISPFYVSSTNSHYLTNGNACNIYLPWNKILVDLSKYLYQRVRIHVASCDCSMSGHYALCYIAGDCQPMELNYVESPVNVSDTVLRIYAPEDAVSYRWYRSKMGELIGEEQNDMNNYVEIVGETGSSLGATMDYFRNTWGEMMTRKTFCCVISTSMNDNLPYFSHVYITVNTPTFYHAEGESAVESQGWVRILPVNGTASGDGLYREGTRLEYTAFPAIENTVFQRWDDGDITNPRIITLTSDTTLYAHFYTTPKHVAAGVSADPSQGNVTVRPLNGAPSGDGQYLEGTQLEFMATPTAERTYFQQWDDGDTINPRVITLLCDTTLTAYFFTADPEEPEGITSEYDTQNSQLTISPNPADGMVRVCVKEPIITITCYDADGRAILTVKPQSECGTIDVTSWSTGQYLLRLTTTSATYTGRLIVR